jgi:hypothetical protein
LDRGIKGAFCVSVEEKRLIGGRRRWISKGSSGDWIRAVGKESGVVEGLKEGVGLARQIGDEPCLFIRIPLMTGNLFEGLDDSPIEGEAEDKTGRAAAGNGEHHESSSSRLKGGLGRGLGGSGFEPYLSTLAAGGSA